MLWFIIKYFITNFFSTYCVYFYLFSCCRDQHSDFIAYTSLCAKYAIKNISNEKYEKLRYCLLKMKWTKVVREKWFFTSIKEHLSSTKGHLDYPEGYVQVEFPQTASCFSHFWFKSRIFFQKRHFLTKCLISGRFLFLKWTFIMAASDDQR